MALRKYRTGVLIGGTLAVFIVFAFYQLDEPEPPANAPRVLVSVDRTLWNRLKFNRVTHVRALRSAGLRAVLTDFGRKVPAPEVADRWLEGMDGLILSGGGDVSPNRYGDDSVNALNVKDQRDTFELALLSAAERRGLPVLGICRGAQLLNVYRGGSLGDFRHDSERYRRHRRVFTGSCRHTY